MKEKLPCLEIVLFYSILSKALNKNQLKAALDILMHLP